MKNKITLLLCALMASFSLSARTIYLNPGVWDTDGAKFAAYTWEPATWSDFMTKGEGDIYEVTIPDGAKNIIFVRCNSAAEAPSWDVKWNQTPDLSIPDGDQMYVITGWGDNDGKWEALQTVPCEPTEHKGDYMLRLNGSLDIATMHTCQDEYLLSNRSLSVGDVINVKGVVYSLDPAGAAANFEQIATGIRCKVAGVYDIYIKPASEQIYIQAVSTEEPPVVEPVETRDIFLVPAIWAADGAKFAAWSWEEGKEGAWSAFGAAGDTVKLAIAKSANKIIFARFAAEAEAPSWESGIWNQTDDLDIPADKDVFTITGWGEGDGAKSVGTWDKVEGGEEPPVVEPIETRDIFLVPAIWAADGAKFAAWSWEEGKDGAWSAFGAAGDTVKLAIAKSANKIIFARFAAEAEAPSWESGIWNQTEDLDIPADKDVFTITGWGEGDGAKSVGTWDKVEGGEEPPVVEPVETRDIFLVPAIWAADGAKFAAWSWEEGKDGAWSAFGAAVDTVKLAIAKSANKIIFARFAAEAEAPSWESGIWNQTDDLDIPADKDVFTITGWGEGDGAKSVGTWDKVEGGEEPPVVEPTGDYYLVGYINGADYGFGEAAADYTAHKFVDGKLKMTFTENSYVFVRTDDKFFMTDGWLGEKVTSAELFENLELGDKLFVPAGEIEFSLEVKESSLVLSYKKEGGEEPPVVEPIDPLSDFYLVGYIEGADYGYGEAAAEYTAHKFVDGKLKLTLTRKAYVFVRTDSRFFMTEGWLGENITSAELFELAEGGDKLCVPAGEIEFNLEVKESSLVLSYKKEGGEEPPVVEPVGDYYLVGYINGADYGYGEAAADYTAYKFVDGKLKMTFTKDSYVFVRTDDKFFMTDGWLGNDVTSAELLELAEGGDKLFVPAGEIEFSLGQKGSSLVLSYTIVGDVPPVVNPEYVTVRFYSDWAVVNAYAWGGSDFGEWPGKALSKGEDGWYAAVIAKGANIIFNDGTFQTVDIENVQTDVCYELGETDAQGHYNVVVNENCTLGDVPPVIEPTGDYYLVGFINGADYGFGEAAADYTAHKFVDGKLEMAFTEESYVFVRTDDKFYVTDGWLGKDVTSAELFEIAEGGDKLFVPAGSWLFTLEQKTNSLVLSYTAVTGFDNLEVGGTINVYDNTLQVATEAQTEMSIYNVAGQLIDSQIVNGVYTRTLNGGLYLIRIGNQSFKVIMK